MKKALQEKDFNKASDEMVDSLWYKQVKRRGPKLVSLMKSAAEEVAEPGTRDADEKIIIVKQGDTLTKISRDQKIDLNELIKANPGINPDKIQIGQKLKLP
jgi:LysM repeat protein